MAIDMTGGMAGLSKTDPMTDLLERRIEAIDLAQDALRAQQKRENPEPLSLEELREMDGEPVWIVRIGSNSPEDKEWALVFVEGGFCRTSVGNIAFLALYGQTWLAYRNKPKEGSKC